MEPERGWRFMIFTQHNRYNINGIYMDRMMNTSNVDNTWILFSPACDAAWCCSDNTCTT